jgi:AICAR transformylase/IMP cyclohydrolase PurH
MDEQGIKEFGLLAVDIGPLDGSLKLGDAIKATRNQIGRIALARGTAKNFRRALVSVNPDYDSLSEQVRGGTSDFAARYGQVAPTFGFTSGYAGDLASTFCRTEVGELSLFGENLEWNPDPALMSVTDKTKIEILAAFMYEKGIKVVSSGGTAKYIGQHVSKEAVTDTSYYTGFPASPDHLVVTLHPELHAASLIGTGQQHERFGLVVINLYDFEQAAREPQYTPEDVRWKVDIGGPSRLWTALLDFPSTAVVFRPSDYGMIMDEIARGDRKSSDSLVLRYNLAKDTLGHLAVYDRSIADYFSQGRTDFVRGFYLEG